MRYLVERVGSAWTLSEGGALMASAGDRDEVVELAELLMMGSKAAGAVTTLSVEGADGGFSMLDTSTMLSAGWRA